MLSGWLIDVQYGVVCLMCGVFLKRQFLSIILFIETVLFLTCGEKVIF